MDTMRICSACKQPLAPNAPEGLCPECLLKAGLGSGVNPGPDSETDSRQRRFAAPAAEALAPLFPQLEIVDLIGQGGMGAVYRARQKNLDRMVALKILPPDIGNDPAFAERFAREARALARLNHPGIVTLYEFGQVAVPDNGGILEAENVQPSTVNPQPPLYFFLMEFVDGVNLRQLIGAGRSSPREALAIVPQICDALQYAHDQGIVHRDIKPENILLDRQGRVKVADFGLAKLVGTGAESSGGLTMAVGSTTLTEAGKVMGTPLYMAPEQLDRPLEVDHRADIYSLGVVFYQMLTGELPAQRIEPPSRKVRLDVRLDEVVLRALEKDPERRYQQASVLKTQVETIAAGRPAPASSMSARVPQSGAARTAPAKSSPPHGILWLRVQMIAASTALMILLLLCGILGYLTFILPRQVALWAEQGAALPVSIRLLVELGRFCQHFSLLLIPLLLLVTGGAAVWLILTLAKSRSRRAAMSPAPAGRSGESDEEQPGRGAFHRVPNSDRGHRDGVESVPTDPGNAQTAGVGIEDPPARPADERSIISHILLAGAFLLPPVLFVWFLLTGHRALGVDLDADAQAFVGLFGLPLSAGVGAGLAWAVWRFPASTGRITPRQTSATGLRWSWLAIASVALLVISLPTGGIALVLLQLVRADSQWNPGPGEFIVTVSSIGAAVILALAATLTGIEGLRRMRRTACIWRGRFGALAAAWFWPVLVGVSLPAMFQASHRAQSRDAYEIRRWEKAELELTRLLPQMRSPDVAQRRQAASAVFTMGSYARSAVPDLLRAMKDDDGLVRMLAAGALGHIGEQAGPQAAAALIDGLTDSDQRARFYAAVALAQVDRSTTANLAVLVETLTNRPPDDPHGIWQIQRREAAEALGVMEGRARTALPVLRALEEDEPSLRNSVQEAIRRIEKSRGEPDQAAIPAQPLAAKSPRETVAEWLRLIKDSQRSREAWELTTREGAGWGPSFTKLEEYDQIRPLHQFGNEQQAMVVSNPFFESRQPRVFYAMLLKREGKWLIADHDRGDPKTVSAIMHGFFMNRGMEFDVLAEELVGHWEGPCLEFTLAADGTGTWLVTGPEGPLPQPQPFQWTVNGAALMFHDAEGERKAKVTWVENDTFHIAYPGGDGRAVWRQKDQEAK